MENSKPTPEEKARANRSKLSLTAILNRLDIFSKFKVIAEIRGITVAAAMREAVIDFINKHSEKKEGE